MKKRALMALPKLTATDEMKQIAASDLPRKEKTDYGYVREVCEYYTYLRCITQDGILKVAFFLPEHLRLDGNSPAYEVYLDKEKRQFITFNSLTQKWCESKLGRLDWIRLPFSKITFTTTTKRAAPKQATVPTAKRKCQSRCILITINKAAVAAADIRWYSKPMDERGICRQKNILPT